MNCVLCDDAFVVDDDLRPIGPDTAHRECMLRAVTGGICHLEDHNYWCLTVGDPDGGRSKRQSALDVDAWIAAGKPMT